MKAREAVKIITRIIGLETLPPGSVRELEAFMELVLSQQPIRKESTVKDQPNDVQPEENTISLTDIEHFDLPKELNLQIEGNQTVQKIKIFPDGISEDAGKEPAVA